MQRFDGKVATFKDGSTAEVDVIMMCTGYLHSYPFLRFKLFCFCELTYYRSCSREELRMKCKNLFYPPGLYKVIKIWTDFIDVCDKTKIKR